MNYLLNLCQKIKVHLWLLLQYKPIGLKPNCNSYTVFFLKAHKCCVPPGNTFSITQHATDVTHFWDFDMNDQTTIDSVWVAFLFSDLYCNLILVLGGFWLQYGICCACLWPKWNFKRELGTKNRPLHIKVSIICILMKKSWRGCSVTKYQRWSVAKYIYASTVFFRISTYFSNYF